MAEPSANKSIRAPVALWEAASAEAARRGVKVNALVVAFMGEALGSGEAGARPSVGKAPPAAAARVAKAADAVRSAEARQAEAAGSGFELSLGRPEAAPGSRLKGANRQPRR